MLKWTDENEKEFRRALAVRKEIDASFSGYFFDQSLAYVLLGTGTSKANFLSNLVHETGHSLLADSPLGLLHHILFELAARCAERLYARVVEPVMREHVKDPTNADIEQLNDLERGGQRDEAARAGVRGEAARAFESARTEMTERLLAESHEPTLRLFRRTQERRRNLIKASQLCHESVAMFHQCGTHASTTERYRKIASLFFAEDETPSLVNELAAEVQDVRTKMSGRWKEGLLMAERILEETGEPRCVYLAARLSHHVPCTDVDILSDDAEGFARLSTSTALHVDRRLKLLAEKPGVLKQLSEATGRPIPIGEIQRELQSEIAVSERAPAIENYATWIAERILEAPIVLAAGDIAKDMAAILRTYPVAKPFEAMHVGKDARPPILLTDGRVIGPPEAGVILKRDFIRAEKVRILERILGRVVN